MRTKHSYLINEAAASDSSGSFETVVFPIVRRVFSKLLANDIVSVQAMNLPIGKLFYFVPKIQSRNADGTHIPPFGAPNGPATTDSGYTNTTNLYDQFYEGSTPNSDPAGLFDYSKGAFTGLTDNCTNVVWSNGSLVAGCDYTGDTRSILVALSGFSNAGAGKLIGPDGQEMDTEDFLASLETNIGGTYFNFRVVTQKYGKGIVQYGTEASAPFPGSGPGGKYDDICDQNGIIYLDIDTSTPAPIPVHHHL